MLQTSTQRLLIATRNRGKVAEFAAILDDLSVAWTTLTDAGITLEVAETGETIPENAVLKATAYGRESGLLTLADDSGLEVDALQGKPGVHTARFGGPGLSAEARYRLLLDQLANVPWPERTARFRCSVAVAAPDGRLLGTADGVCEGVIALRPAGDGGFGYDPVFFLPEYGRTMAQLPASEKHKISHRGRAAAKIAPLLRELLS